MMALWPGHTCPCLIPTLLSIVQEFVEFLKKEAPQTKLHYIPANCTGRLQPADVGLQKPFKDGARDCFAQYILSETQLQRAAGVAVADCRMSLKMSAVKPLVPAFLLAGFKRLTPEVVLAAWRKSGLLD